MPFTDLVSTPLRQDINSDLSPARLQTMLDVFGRPGALTTDCADVTNEKLQAMIATRDVGPFRASGLQLALDDLTSIFADVKQNNPALYAVLGTAGMLCCRLVRGSSSHFSNHSWGTAIDMKIGGLLSPLNATAIPTGLLALYPFFHKSGWFWAAGYNGRTDPMHFEVANEKILAWKQNGKV